MKKNLHIFKSFALLLVFIVTATIVNAQTRTATASGNWNNNATWGGQSFPTSVNDVVIPNGFTVTVNVPSACRSIVINNGTTVTGITVNTGQSLTVASVAAVGGNIDINPGTDGTSARTITLSGSATLVAETLNMADVGAGNSASTLAINTGSATFSSAIVLNGAAGAENFITVAAGGTLFIGGTISATNGALNPATDGIVNYNGAAQTVRSDAYDRLTLSGSGVKTLPTTITIADDLDIAGSASVTTANAITVGNDLNLSNTASLTTGATFAVTDAMTLDAGTNLTVGAFNFSVGGATIINGTLTSNSTTGTKSFGDLTINSGGVFNSTADEAYSIVGDLTFNTGATLTSGTGLWSFSGGSLIGAGNPTITNAVFTSNYTNTGTFTFTNMDITGGGNIDFTNNGTINVTTALTGADEFIQGANDILNFGGTSIAIATFTPTAADNLVNYNALAAQTVRGVSYQFLTLSGSGAKTVTGATINDVLSMQGTATAIGTAPTYAAAAILEYKGSAAQTTTNVEFVGAGTNPTNLRIDNAAGVTLNAAKIIGGALTLTNGYLTTTNTNLLTIGSAGTAATTNGAFVNGPLAKQKSSTTIFTFPVGTIAGGLRTIAVTPSTAGTVTYRAQFFSANPRTVPNGNNLGTIQRISACEYWDLSQTSGTTSARVTLSWPTAAQTCGTWGYVSNPATVFVAHHNGTNWVNEGNGGTTVVGGNSANGGTVITTGNVATFSPFTLGSNDAANPLPVTFGDVKAFEKGTGVQLDWTNLTEKDLVNYIVERSANGRDFTAISSVTARSNQNDAQGYTSFDASPLPGVNFYRIKTVEVDGKVTYSKLLKVEIGKTQKGLVLYPNPVMGNEVSIGFTGAKGQYTLRVINGAGQEIMTQRITHAGGTVSQAIALPSTIKPGVYNMLLSGDNFKETKLFIVQ